MASIACCAVRRVSVAPSFASWSARFHSSSSSSTSSSTSTSTSTSSSLPPSPSPPLPSYLDKRLKAIAPSATLGMMNKMREMEAEGKSVYKFGFGESPFPVLPSIIKELQNNAHQNSYLPVAGLPALRSAIAQFHESRQKIPTDADCVMVGPGSKELMFLLQMVHRGEVFLSAPSWVSYLPQAHLNGRRVVVLPTSEKTGWKPTGTAIDQICSNNPFCRRLLIINYPNNPTGLSFSPQELNDLAEACRKHQVLVLSDEIYSDLHYGDSPHLSLSALYPEGTIVSSGMSKSFGAGGWRLGYFVFPPNLKDLLQAMCVVGSSTFSAVSAPVQYAAVAGFRNSEDLAEYLIHSRRILRGLNKHISSRMIEAGISVHPATGAFYMFPNFEPFREKLASKYNVHNSIEFSQKLLSDTGVAVLPGSHFLMPEDTLTQRMAFVDFDGERALQVSRSVPGGEMDELSLDTLKSFSAKQFEGIDKMIDWLKA